MSHKQGSAPPFGGWTKSIQAAPYCPATRVARAGLGHGATRISSSKHSGSPGSEASTQRIALEGPVPSGGMETLGVPHARGPPSNGLPKCSNLQPGSGLGSPLPFTHQRSRSAWSASRDH